MDTTQSANSVAYTLNTNITLFSSKLMKARQHSQLGRMDFYKVKVRLVRILLRWIDALPYRPSKSECLQTMGLPMRQGLPRNHNANASESTFR